MRPAAAHRPHSHAPGSAARRRRHRRRLAGLARLAVFALVLTLAVWVGVRAAHAGADAALYTGTRYEVKAGDTLWGIAARSYDQSIDVRRAIYDIRQVNGLEHSVLQPGQTLVLPYEGE